jgi:hypothetical protein
VFIHAFKLLAQRLLKEVGESSNSAENAQARIKRTHNMNYQHFGIALVATIALLITGCIGQSNPNSADNDNLTIDSPLVERDGAKAMSIQPQSSTLDLIGSIQTVFDYKKVAKTSEIKSRWLTSCEQDCRNEAGMAGIQCQKDGVSDCDNESQDVFDTCVQYDCNDDSADQNALPADHQFNPAEVEQKDLLLVCQEACGEQGTKVYLNCIEETQGSEPIRCRENADEAAHSCVVAHCAGLDA